MAERSGGGEPTEEPTPKRLREARQRGEVAQSRDLAGAASLVGALLVVAACGAAGAGSLGALLRRSLTRAVDGSAEPASALADSGATLLIVIAPVLGAAMVAGAIVAFLQVGPLLTFEPIKPKLERVDLVSGLGRMFGTASLGEAARSLLKAVLVGWAALSALGDRWAALLTDGAWSARLGALGALALAVGLRALGVLLVMGGLDYLLKRRAYHKRQRMTRAEVKREHREEEGDPRHKAERRRAHRRLLQERAMRAVPRASVVITNPTHLAVALRYERASMRAPAVTAKGQHLHAHQIRSLARTHGVPIRRDPPLARALFELELEEEIPEALYDAVAEVLRVLRRTPGEDTAPTGAVPPDGEA